jgi:hypothetical protein
MLNRRSAAEIKRHPEVEAILITRDNCTKVMRNP